MLNEFTTWLAGLVKSFLSSLWQLISDAFVNVCSYVFDAIASAIASIPVPSFLTQYSLSALIAQMPSDVLYFAAQLKLGTAFAILGAGFTFRMLRKIFTLGQW